MKKYILMMLFFVLFCSLAFATDQVTLTTYYPAPFGMYQQMRVSNNLGVKNTSATLAYPFQVGATPGGTVPSANIDATIERDLWVGGNVYSANAGPWSRTSTGRVYTTNTNDKVGIRTSSPTSALTVRGAPTGDAAILASTPAWNSTGYWGIAAMYSGDPSYPANKYGALYVSGTGASLGYGIYQEKSSQNYFENKVGIGQNLNLPEVPLHVYSSSSLLANAAGYFAQRADRWGLAVYQGAVADSPTIPDISPQHRGGIYIKTDSGTPGRFGIYQEGAPDNYFAGNVGIGTSVPFSPLHVMGSGNYASIFQQTPATGYAVMAFQGMSNIFSPASSGGMFIRTQSTDVYGIYQENSGKNYFEGNVGIGTSLPAKPLDVAGEAKFYVDTSVSTGDCNETSELGKFKFTDSVARADGKIASALYLCAKYGPSSSSIGWREVIGEWTPSSIVPAGGID